VLVELQIEHFALIDSAHLEFREGFNVLTGETGAGKSIILDALGFLLGDPLGEGTRGGKRVRVSGRFLLSPEARQWMAEQGWEAEEEALAVRELSPGGRSACRLNGRICTLSQLRELGHLLLEIHSQHQSNTLLRPSRHLELLDRLCGPAHGEKLESYRTTYRTYQQLEQQLQQLSQAERERNRQLEWLRHEVEEIREAELDPAEEQQLEADIRRLGAAQELGQRSAALIEQLDGEGGCLDRLGTAQKSLQALLRLDPSAQTFAEALEQSESLLGELIHQLHHYRERLQCEPDELDRMQRRSEQLRSLKRKYGPHVEAILDYYHEACRRLDELENAEERREQLQQQRQQVLLELEEQAARLHGLRSEQARRLEQEVAQQLADLNLAAMRFQVQLERVGLNPQGHTQLEFYLAPNPGTPPLPLARIASGGELSRIMLAIIGIFAKFEPLTTLIFDEIDAGLGGRAAEAVARKLDQLGRDRQVLCVTHLAVIAAAANHHILVSKSSDQEHTQLTLSTLQGKSRESEIARMLSGDSGAQSAQRLARELLKGDSLARAQNR